MFDVFFASLTCSEMVDEFCAMSISLASKGVIEVPSTTVGFEKCVVSECVAGSFFE